MSAAAIGDWRELAACAGHDPELWYPSSGRYTPEGKRAKAICNTSCPVREPCLADALSQGVEAQYGIWGGMTARERVRAIKGSRSVPAYGSVRRLRALGRSGWSSADIAAAAARRGTELTPRYVAEIRSGRRDRIGPAVEAAIRAAYEHLSGARNERRTGSVALSRAAAAWPAPEEWAGVDIDDPRARPRTIRRRAA